MVQHKASLKQVANLSGVQTNNVTKEADAMPLGSDGMQRLAELKQHEKDLADMQKDYVEVAKKRNTMREELVKAGFDPARKPVTMPREMAEKMSTLGTLEQDVSTWQKKLAEKRKTAPVPPPLGMSVKGPAELPAQPELAD